MNLTKLKLLFHTVKHLRWEQVYYRVFYGFQDRFFKKEYTKKLVNQPENLAWSSPIFYQNSYLKNKTFRFLNIEHHFSESIDWNENSYGKLWTYNLNYFDFLHQENIEVDEGIYLINRYISKSVLAKDGKEPYPTSLRGINWIKFLSRHSIEQSNIQQHLYNQYQQLMHRLEYHLLGNHLLENAFSLLFAAYYFKDDAFYTKANSLLKRELKEQIHLDGGHFELSPMYHKIILHRLLDCIQLLRLNPWKVDSLLTELKAAAGKMCAWLDQISFKNGDIPLFNDSAKGIAVPTKALLSYASALSVDINPIPLGDSGYRYYTHEQMELLVDIGQVGPSYQPGHAHADTFGFVIYHKEKPLLIDPGISTYEINEQRSLERATKFHNSVTPEDESNSSQVWSGFRVAKRAKVTVLHDDEDYLMAEHTGFKSIHQRSFSCRDDALVITDFLIHQHGKAYFHFAPGVALRKGKGTHEVLFEGGSIQFSSCDQLSIETYQCPNGYNQFQAAKKIVVLFRENLISTIDLN